MIKCADSVIFYYMHDQHYFTQLIGRTLDDVLAHADTIERRAGGMLCPAVLLAGGKELRRVGLPVQSHGGPYSWDEGKIMWRKALEADADVMRLLHSSG